MSADAQTVVSGSLSRTCCVMPPGWTPGRSAHIRRLSGPPPPSGWRRPAWG